jgi:hypothetical protein
LTIVRDKRNRREEKRRARDGVTCKIGATPHRSASGEAEPYQEEKIVEEEVKMMQQDEIDAFLYEVMIEGREEDERLRQAVGDEVFEAMVEALSATLH